MVVLTTNCPGQDGFILEGSALLCSAVEESSLISSRTMILIERLAVLEYVFS